MKKLFFVFISLCLTQASFAQFNKHRLMIGGSLRFAHHSKDSKSGGNTIREQTTTSYSFQPSVGLFIANNLAVGMAFNNTIDETNYEVGSSRYSSTLKSYEFQSFIRYYLKSRVFFQGELGIGSGGEKNYSNYGGTESENFTMFHWGVLAGYAIVINNFVSIEPAISYASVYGNYQSSDEKIRDNGLSINIGLQVYLGKN